MSLRPVHSSTFMKINATLIHPFSLLPNLELLLRPLGKIDMTLGVHWMKTQKGEIGVLRIVRKWDAWRFLHLVIDPIKKIINN